MEQALLEIAKTGAGGGAVAVLVLLFLLAKMGLLNLSIGKKTNGYEEKIRRNQEDIEKLFDHAQIANEEMASVKTSLENMDKRMERMEDNIITILEKV